MRRWSALWISDGGARAAGLDDPASTAA